VASPAVVALKRVYEPAEPADGTRVLVERLWPRGLSKERAHVDLWLKDIAPSPELRTWYGHDPAKYAEFRRRYEAELIAPPASAVLAELCKLAGRQKITLVVAAHDLELSTAPVIRDALKGCGVQ
jgi:uncharacterized protein YeaO (DUF488 family)